MRVTYFDEVKANPTNGQVHYFVGGISLPMGEIAGVEAQVNELAKEVFGTTELMPTTEFHGADIYFRKGAFKGRDTQVRIYTLGRLARIISGNPNVKRVYAAIDTTKLFNTQQAPEFAFAHFCERVQMLVGKSATTLLIGDLDHEHAADMIAAFSRYRVNGTPWDYGIAVNGIVDAVHFARSHHSRMVQLADIYLFLETHTWGTRKGWMAEALTKELKGVELYAHRYKIWPK